MASVIMQQVPGELTQRGLALKSPDLRICHTDSGIVYVRVHASCVGTCEAYWLTWIDAYLEQNTWSGRHLWLTLLLHPSEYTPRCRAPQSVLDPYIRRDPEELVSLACVLVWRTHQTNRPHRFWIQRPSSVSLLYNYNANVLSHICFVMPAYKFLGNLAFSLVNKLELDTGLHYL